MARLDRFYCFKHQVTAFKSSSIIPVGISDHSLVQCSVFIKNVKCNSAYWHFNVTLLSDNVFKKAFECFWNNYRQTKSEYSSLQQWWDVGKGKIKQLCQQYTLNVTRDMARSMKALETEIVELQTPQEKENIFKFSKEKSQLYLTCWVFLLKVLWSDPDSSMFLRWTLPLISSSVWNRRTGRGGSYIPCGPTLESCCRRLLRFVGVRSPSMRSCTTESFRRNQNSCSLFLRAYQRLQQRPVQS